MPGNKRPKKKYRPSGLTHADRVASTALPLRLASGHKMTAAQLRDMSLAAHTALRAIEDGNGTENDLHQLAFTSNVSLIMAERGLGTEYLEEVKQGQQHIVELVGRHNRKQSLLLTGPGIVAVRRILELHDAQIEHSAFTEGMAYASVHAVLNRMYAGEVMAAPA